MIAMFVSSCLHCYIHFFSPYLSLHIASEFWVRGATVAYTALGGGGSVVVPSIGTEFI
jgi:hypothetical protein